MERKREGRERRKVRKEVRREEREGKVREGEGEKREERVPGAVCMGIMVVSWCWR